MSPGVSQALAALRPADAEAASLVFPGIVENRAAETFREHLRAGVDRAELFESTAARRQIRAHDLRATFVTLSLAAGRSEAWVADRTGHRSSQMINRYRRQARQASELGFEGLAPLVLCIPELSPLDGIGRALAKLSTGSLEMAQEGGPDVVESRLQFARFLNDSRSVRGRN